MPIEVLCRYFKYLILNNIEPQRNSEVARSFEFAKRVYFLQRSEKKIPMSRMKNARMDIQRIWTSARSDSISEWIRDEYMNP